LVPAYVSNCKSCSRRIDVDWDGDHRLLPFPSTCRYCGHPDGYGDGELLLVGAFEVTCRQCGDDFPAEIPSANVDYTRPTGLVGPVPLICQVCGHQDFYAPEEIVWLGRGDSMPQASARAGGPGQERP
jgi:hypothetical protein